jgi:hypothetical protein
MVLKRGLSNPEDDNTPEIRGSINSNLVVTRGLSNPEFQEMLERVRKLVERHGQGSPTIPAAPERMMSVSDAIASVLSACGNETMRMCEIHRAVDEMRERTVPRSTIKNNLATARFERVSRGRYRLINDWSLD